MIEGYRQIQRNKQKTNKKKHIKRDSDSNGNDKEKKAVKNNWSEKVKKSFLNWVIYRDSRGRGGIKFKLKKRTTKKRNRILNKKIK